MTVELRESYTMDPTFFEFFPDGRPEAPKTASTPRDAGERSGQPPGAGKSASGLKKTVAVTGNPASRPKISVSRLGNSVTATVSTALSPAEPRPALRCIRPDRPGTESKPEPPCDLGAQAGTHRGIWQDNADDALGVTAHLIRLECEHYALWHESRNGGHTRAGC